MTKEENLLELNGELSFAIERHKKHLRLIVYKQGQEYVCRKERSSAIERFLTTDELRIFKGRLQLWKKQNDIFVEVKGETVGVLHLQDFKKLLENI
jgi:hypothetical protein